ncbi:MAG TPA: efflux RND transporter permease subunit [Gemmataceae bacterium]|jgi:cobalt-zinc-cadmium resistance protein CzcA
MVRKLIEWAVGNALIVVLLAICLAAFGVYAFNHVNVEAYPDPAPAIIEVVAQYPGFSAEEVERRVTIPLEVTLAGMPGLQYTRSKSLAGLCHLRNQFEYGVDYYAARQEVINRLQFVQNLPANVNPQISPFTPTGELIRYTLDSPKNSRDEEIYSLLDLKSLQDWVLDREFRRIPRIAAVSSFGGMVKRYEIQPDPDRLKRYGVGIQQFQTTISNNNANIGAGYLGQGPIAMNVRSIGLIGRGQDPMRRAVTMKSPYRAARHLCREEEERVREIRDLVVVSVNNVPIRVEDLVTGGPADEHDDLATSIRRRKKLPRELLGGEGKNNPHSREGVLVGYQPRLGKVSVCRPKRDDKGEVVRDDNGDVVWIDEEDKVQGIVLMRKNEATLLALNKVKEKVEELNDPQGGRLLPDVKIVPHFDLTGLIHVTTETVRENLLIGMMLVTVILFMFLSNVRSALIVAINIPLALLFAFSVLFLRGKSANLLSIGAVDFGIIVDSSVIMVENIYRHVSSGEYSELPLKERIIRACHEVERPLFFSTLIMVFAFIPLFTMQGPEGQIFGPMADTYAFALGGALLLALTVAPVLCYLFFKNLKPSQDNWLVRWLKRSYLRQLEICLNHRFITLGVFGLLAAGTVALLPYLGREFMPELEEGNLYIRGTFPINVSLEEAADKTRRARAILREYPEVALVASQVGRPDDGTDPTGFYNAEFSIPLRPEKEWPTVMERTGLLSWLGPRARTKPELIEAMNKQMHRELIGVDWNFSQYIRDNVMESLSGVKGDNSVKIIGPDLDELEKLADRVKAELDAVPGLENVAVFRIKGQPNLEFTVDRSRCKFWNVSVAEVENAIAIAVGGQAATQMVEGEKSFDITLRWPERLRGNEQAILDIPIEVANNTVTQGSVPGTSATNVTGASVGVNPLGTNVPMPSLWGNVFNAAINSTSSVPRLRLGQLVSPVNDEGLPDPNGKFLRSGASTIYREQGKRFIAVKFSVRGRDLAGGVAEAQARTAHLFTGGYRAEWSGEFQEMLEAEHRLMLIVPLSLAAIFVLLYLAFHDLIDALMVFSNVGALALGGIWALLLTGTHFSISAAVGFISLFGVAIMDGLLMISYFNQLRAHGLPLKDAIMQGAEKRMRPMMMTDLTAILGLLPAALSTRIGAQTQRPLAIVVVGGMITTLFLTRYLMPVLYSFYGHREPRAHGGGLAH